MLHTNNIKRILPVLLGNSLETYDFYLYGFLAPTFAVLFFPQHLDKSLSIIFAFGIFMTAYISRPVGILVWGHIADKYGRKPVLIGTLSVMTVPAIGMACVPVYNDIGLWATVSIIILRLLQGFSLGGEYPTSMVTVYELAPQHRKGLYTSFCEVHLNVGVIIAIIFIACLSGLLSHEQFLSWGWRILFLFSIVAIFVIGYIRFNLIETITKTVVKAPSMIAITKDWKTIVKIVAYLSTANVLYFSFILHSIILVENYTDIELSHSMNLLIQAMGIVFFTLMYPFMGHFSDIVGRKKLIAFGLISLLILCFPMYFMLFYGNPVMRICVVIAMAIFIALITGTFIPMIVEQAKEQCRVSTVGLGHGISIVLFGSTIPMVNETLISILNTKFAPAFYIIFTTLLSLISLYFMKNKQIFKEQHVRYNQTI